MIVLSDRELASSIESPPPRGLSPVQETTSTTQVGPRGVDSDDGWSVVGDGLEADGEASGNEGGRRRRRPLIDAI